VSPCLLSFVAFAAGGPFSEDNGHSYPEDPTTRCELPD
jgi:hypothetical protein